MPSLCFYKLALFFIIYLWFSPISHSSEKMDLLEEIRKMLSAEKFDAQNELWHSQLMEIKKSTHGRNVTDEALVAALNKALTASGFPQNSILEDGSWGVIPFTNNKAIMTSGVISERRGKYNYVKYIIPGTPASAMGIKRGDRLDLPVPFYSSLGTVIATSIKSSAWVDSSKQKITLTKASWPELVQQYTKKSQNIFDSVSYIHVLDCSKLFLSDIRNHLHRHSSWKKVIIDFRDSYCSDELPFLSLLSEAKYKDNSFILLTNRFTRGGAEKILTHLTSKGRAIIVGETTGGLIQNHKVDPIISTPYFLIVPERLHQAPVEPHIFVPDQIVFSNGQDVLLNTVLKMISNNELKI